MESLFFSMAWATCQNLFHRLTPKKCGYLCLAADGGCHFARVLHGWMRWPPFCRTLLRKWKSLFNQWLNLLAQGFSTGLPPKCVDKQGACAQAPRIAQAVGISHVATMMFGGRWQLSPAAIGQLQPLPGMRLRPMQALCGAAVLQRCAA